MTNQDTRRCLLKTAAAAGLTALLRPPLSFAQAEVDSGNESSSSFDAAGALNQSSQFIARYEYRDNVEYGLVRGETVIGLDGDLFGDYSVSDRSIAIADVRLLAPVTPRKIIGLGSNSYWHRSKMAGEDITGKGSIPASQLKPPAVFEKARSSVAGPGDRVCIPEGTTGISGSAELAVIISRRAGNVSTTDAGNYIFGYTCAFDGFAPEIAVNDFDKAKNYPTFCPLGPWIATGINHSDLMEVVLRVNGGLHQKGYTDDYILGIADAVSLVTSRYELEAGDVILVGALGSGGIAEDEEIADVPGFTDIEQIRAVAYPKYQHGDTLEVSIDRIGAIRLDVRYCS